MKSWSRHIQVNKFPIALKFDSSAAKVPVKIQSDKIIMTSNLAASRLHEIWW